MNENSKNYTRVCAFADEIKLNDCMSLGSWNSRRWIHAQSSLFHSIHFQWQHRRASQFQRFGFFFFLRWAAKEKCCWCSIDSSASSAEQLLYLCINIYISQNYWMAINCKIFFSRFLLLYFSIAHFVAPLILVTGKIFNSHSFDLNVVSPDNCYLSLHK